MRLTNFGLKCHNLKRFCLKKEEKNFYYFYSMTEYVYPEREYISPKDYVQFNEMMEGYNWDPCTIEDKREFQIVLRNLVSLIIRAPQFLPVYNYAYRMIERVDQEDLEVLDLSVQVEKGWFSACLNLIEKENLYDKLIPWKYKENRSLLRGLNEGAEVMWIVNELNGANKIFSLLMKINPEDQTGARFCAKATELGISHEEFESRFVLDENGDTKFDFEKLEEWYQEK